MIYNNNQEEEIKIKFKSDFKDRKKFITNLEKNISKEIFLGYTSIGIHKDDFNIMLNERNIEKYGSQGQQRSSILSLKISEMEILKLEINENPILILDDFMSELDENRIKRFLNNMENAQIILTATEKIELEKYLDKKEEYNIKYINIKNGKIMEE